MTSPDGRDSPSTVGVFLIWQQPHPIYYAELCYQAYGDRATLEKYRRIVFETAEFIASYPVWDQASERYVLGPAMIPAQESYGRGGALTSIRPSSWLTGISVWIRQQKWRQRLGLQRDPNWDRVIRRLSQPTIRDGVYTALKRRLTHL
jgi:hypothetical protein